MQVLRKHIAVATDFSASSVEALRHAVRLARRDRARITAVHVVGGYVPEVGWPSIWAVPPNDARARLREILGAELEQMLAEVDSDDVEIASHLAFGDPAVQLTRWARDSDVDMLVIAPTGKSGFERLVLGSTARTVLATSTVPVWIARGEPVAGHCVVAGIDLLPGGEHVLEVALAQARAEGVPLQMVHAYADPGEERVFAVSSWEDQHRYRELVVREHRERFDAWCATHAPEGPDVGFKMIAGRAWRVLQQTAVEQGATVVVVGRHEHGAVHQLFIGSTADALVRRAPCPVLVVP